MKLDFSVYPVLHTTRLSLRALTDSDAAALQDLRSDMKVNQYLDRPAPASREDILNFIDKIRNSILQKASFYWVITAAGSDELIGTICLWHIDSAQGSAEIGYELHPAYWGKGLMQEAVEAVLNFSFEQIGLQVMTAVLDNANERSVKLLLKNNFIPDTDHTWVSESDAAGLAVYFRVR